LEIKFNYFLFFIFIIIKRNRGWSINRRECRQSIITEREDENIIEQINQNDANINKSIENGSGIYLHDDNE
jgi:hypothetical protein